MHDESGGRLQSLGTSEWERVRSAHEHWWRPTRRQPFPDTPRRHLRQLRASFLHPLTIPAVFILGQVYDTGGTANNSATSLALRTGASPAPTMDTGLILLGACLTPWYLRRGSRTPPARHTDQGHSTLFSPDDTPETTRAGRHRFRHRPAPKGQSDQAIGPRSKSSNGTAAPDPEPKS